jgi:hypothetical protein
MLAEGGANGQLKEGPGQLQVPSSKELPSLNAGGRQHLFALNFDTGETNWFFSPTNYGIGGLNIGADGTLYSITVMSMAAACLRCTAAVPSQMPPGLRGSKRAEHRPLEPQRPAFHHPKAVQPLRGS